MWSEEENMDLFARRFRVFRRNILRSRAAVDELIDGTPVPTMTSVTRIQLEEPELKQFRSALSEVLDNALSVIQATTANEKDPKKRDQQMTELEDQWSDSVFELRKEITDVLARIASYVETYTGSNQASATKPLPICDVKLKPIKIPTFSGDPKQFPEFKALFTNLIHGNREYSNIQKFHRLKEALSGNAALIVRDFPFTDQAYLDAWSALNMWFDNKRAAISSHLEDLFKVGKAKDKNQAGPTLLSIDSAIGGLKACGVELEKDSVVLAYHLYSRLDDKTQYEWNMHFQDRTRYAKYDELRSFVLNRISALPTTNPTPSADTKAGGSTASLKKAPTPTKKSYAASSDTTDRNCPACSKGAHLLIACAEFKAKSVQQRWEVVKGAKMCWNCFNRSHSANACDKGNCKNCGKRHHTLLCLGIPSSKDITAKPPSNAIDEAKPTDGKLATHPPTCSSTVVNSSEFNCVLLPTALVKFVCGRALGKLRVLLDSASQFSFISDEVVRRRRLPASKSAANRFVGLGGGVVSNQICHMTILSRSNENFRLPVVLSVLPASSMIYRRPTRAAVATCQMLRRRKMTPADEAGNSTAIDILLGAEYFEACMLMRREILEGVTFRLSYFGWVALGQIPEQAMETTSCFSIIHDIDSDLRRFWEVEDVEPSSQGENEEEERQRCEEHFLRTYQRDADGRFVVRLPIKGDTNLLAPDSRVRAEKVLLSHERKATADPDLRRAYVEFMREYECLAHMTLVPPDEISRQPAYYIPHHAVLKPDSSTTKLRTVFNASAKTSTGVSLNDVLMIGKTLQSDLADIISRFRSHKVAFTADITKMYRQISVHPSDRDLQRILWREDRTEPVKTFRLNTVTYGTVPASFLATKCLDILADSVQASEPIVARTIRSDFYMDDLLTGADNVDDAKAVRRAIHDLLLSAHLPLRKYASNSAELLDDMPPEIVGSDSASQLDPKQTTSVLGLSWHHQTDAFSLRVRSDELCNLEHVTKRAILSIVSRIFDPKGFVTPLVTPLKVVLQSLFKEKVGWDDRVSEPLAATFRKRVMELLVLPDFAVRRQYSSFSPARQQLVGFCDASRTAYSAVVYVRSFDVTGGVDCYLVSSKSRVAPIKQLSIHRLELLAAALLTKLLMREAANLHIDDVVAFSDSQVTLSWLAKPPETWQVFIANRVREIQCHLPISHWSYVPTAENPADIPTRDFAGAQLLRATTWLRGPPFIRSDCRFSPWKDTSSVDPPERRRKACLITAASLPYIGESVSTFRQLVSVAVVARRFAANCRSKHADARVTGPFTADEYKAAEIALIRGTQMSNFGEAYTLLETGSLLPRKSCLFRLSPFVDESGLIRMSSRVQNPLLPEDRRNPMILPSNCRLLLLYTEHLHRRYFHARRHFLKTFILSRFWIVGGINALLKRLLRRCVDCVRRSSPPTTQLMAPLPAVRTTAARPFATTGVDYFGPFDVKRCRHRREPDAKAYGLIFVCFAVRAVHLEVTSDLTTERFLDAYGRFAARRGMPNTVHSDNAKTFVAAAKCLARDGISWVFTTPRAPHHGGLWEAAVKSAKSHLLRVLHGQPYTYETLATLFADVEAVLNGRPLVALPDASDESMTLSPSHFLIGGHLGDNGPLLQPSESSLSARWGARQQLLNAFWTAWHGDYINYLRQRTKWHSRQPNLKEGQVVAVKDETLPCIGMWPLGRITRVLQDKAGDVRSVDVRVRQKIYRRPITRIIPLPVDEEPVSPSPGERVSTSFNGLS